jgi:hypothetical protein
MKQVPLFVPVGIPPNVGIHQFYAASGWVVNIVEFVILRVTIQKNEVASIVMTFDEISPPGSWKTTHLWLT